MKIRNLWLKPLIRTLAILILGLGTLIQPQFAHDGKVSDVTYSVPRESSSKSSSTAPPFDVSELAELDTLEFDRKLVKGAPFSATLMVEQVQRLADGASSTRTLVSLIYRDPEGRTRRERIAETHGVAAPVSDHPVSVTINDPVAGLSYVLDPRTNVARRSMFVALVEPGANGEAIETAGHTSTKQRALNSQVLPLLAADELGQKLQPTAAASSSSNVKRESLGQRQIEGITAEGTRIAMKIPAGTMKNEKAIEIVAERWYSPTLRTVIMIESSDSRLGKSTYRLTDIKSGEPLPGLFIVPGDYKIRD